MPFETYRRGGNNPVPAPDDIIAVYGNGTLIHLYVEGYRTTKARSVEAPLCGAGLVSTESRWGPTGRVQVPLPRAIELESQDRASDDPRPVGKPFRWCPKCLGIAVDLVGLTPWALQRLTHRGVALR